MKNNNLTLLATGRVSLVDKTNQSVIDDYASIEAVMRTFMTYIPAFLSPRRVRLATVGEVAALGVGADSGVAIFGNASPAFASNVATKVFDVSSLFAGFAFKEQYANFNVGKEHVIRMRLYRYDGSNWVEDTPYRREIQVVPDGSVNTASEYIILPTAPTFTQASGSTTVSGVAVDTVLQIAQSQSIFAPVRLLPITRDAEGGPNALVFSHSLCVFEFLNFDAELNASTGNSFNVDPLLAHRLSYVTLTSMMKDVLKANGDVAR
jgi:hypothetical protein